jgi:peptidoglycan/LPS O-acetylase OafA/YrhL
MWRIVGGDSSSLAYRFWLVIGAVTAMHLQGWHRWVMWRIALSMISVAMAGTVLVWTHLRQLTNHDPVSASSPMQPVLLFWSVAALAALYPVAVALSTTTSPWLRQVIDRGAQWSFGIYWLHPLALDGVLIVLTRCRLLTASVWSSLLMLPATTLVTVPVCALLQHTGRGRLLIGCPARPGHRRRPSFPSPDNRYPLVDQHVAAATPRRAPRHENK